MDDQRLEYLGHRFAGRGMGTLLRISFEHYLTAPERYDAEYARLMRGDCGYNVSNGRQRLVAVGGN